MARTTPRIRDGILAIQEGTQEYTVLLESGPWWDWLNAESQRTFYFENALGSFTARREYKHGGWYWYAYRKHADRLHKIYLGKSEALTIERLNATAAALGGLQGGELALLDIGRADQPPNGHQRQEPVGNLLLMTKLSVPPARTGLIDRPRLIKQLAKGLDRKLTLISAQAGFGKTSLLSQWVQESRMPVTWVSLDEADNDPVRFWSYIITALQTAHPAVKTVPTTLLHTPKQPEIETVLTALLNSINTIARPFVLVLDDYHVIETQVIHNSVAFPLDHLPPQMHLTVASRTDPPLPLARLRARNQLTELHATDLRFDMSEAATFLNQTMDLQLPKETIIALEKRTEGWIAGLHLAALSLQGQSDTSSFIAAFTGNHRYIFDYLVDEVLNHQTETVQTFLLHTSILDRLCAALCEAITDQPQAQRLLEQLEQANLFLVALDDERRWYRYHQLFADVLRDRLQRLYPHMLPLLHQQAASWYAQNNLIPLAITHALVANDLDYAAQLIEQVAELMIKRGEGTTLLRWIETLPEEQLRARPHLAFFYAGTLIVVGQSDAAEARLQALEQQLTTNQSTSPEINNTEAHQMILGEINAARAAAAAYAGDVTQTVTLVQLALSQLPESELFARSILVASLGLAYWWSGDLAASDKAFAEARVISQANGNPHVGVASLSGQGCIQFVRGKLRRATEIYQQALQEATETDRQLLPVASTAESGLGEVLYQQNDLEKAEQFLRDGIEHAKQWGDPRTLAYTYTLLAHVLQAQGDPAGTQALMVQAKHLAEQHHLTQHITIVAASHAWLCLKQGNLDAAIRWADTWEPHWQVRSCYSRDLEFAAFVLVRVRIAQRQFHKVDAVLTPILSAAEATEETGSIIEALTLQALAYQLRYPLTDRSNEENPTPLPASPDVGHSNRTIPNRSSFAPGDTMPAMRALSQALALAAPEGYIRMFVDEGPPMASLLVQIMQAQQTGQSPDLLAIPPDYIRTLLAALGHETHEQQSPQHQPAQRSAPDLLSEREIEVLRLVAAGLSNQEIAQEMVVALSTVKWHIKNIYSILDVHNRAQAIKRAREIYLLPES